MSKMGRVALELQEHGFESLQEAQEQGFELVGDKLYLRADKALQNVREELLGYIDEVIAYLKAEQGDDKAYMVDNLKEVEKYIKEN